MITVGEIRGMKIVTDDSDVDVLNAYRKRDNNCIKKSVCVGCERCYAFEQNKHAWFCGMASDKDGNHMHDPIIRHTIYGGNEQKGYRVLDGCAIPDECHRKLEHMVMTQKENEDDK